MDPSQGTESVVAQDVVVDFPIDDRELVSLFDQLVGEAKKDFTQKFKDRADKNFKMWKGDQVKEDQLEEHETPYIDNIIWQDLKHQIALSVGRIPDIVCIPGNNHPKEVDNARILEKRLNQHKPTWKRLLRDALRNYSFDYTAAIKVLWDPEADNGKGDYKFALCRRNKFGFNATATIPQDGFTAENMLLIYEYISEPLQLVMAKFPKAKQQLEELYALNSGRPLKKSSDEIEYLEGWFTYFDKNGRRHDFIAHKHRNILLGKDMNPYYDFEGYYKPTFNQQGIMQFGEPMFRNFFDRPRKPYIFITYENTGESARDDTTAIEQTIPLQRNVNRRGSQISLIADRMVPKMAFNKAIGTKEDVENITNDPRESIFLDSNEDVRSLVTSFQSNPPSPALFNDLMVNRTQIDAKFSTSGTVRGEAQNFQESGVSKQITREGSLVTVDDMAEVVIERVIYEMASWAVQMMKLKYDKEHYVREMGQDGETVNEVISQDKISDGMALQVRASSNDKPARRAMAFDLARIKAVDPLTMNEMLDLPNPKQATKRLMAFLQGQQDGYQRYMQEVGLLDQESGAGGPNSLAPQMDAQQAMLDIQTIIGGQMPQPNGQPSIDYAQAFVDFRNSTEYSQLNDQSRNIFAQYVSQIKQSLAATQGAPQ